jgi:molybdopterin-binding protein
VALFFVRGAWCAAYSDGITTAAQPPQEAVTMGITAINVRNQFRGKIKEIIEGPVVTEIDVETPSGLLVTSVITTRSVKELGLVVGKEVIALVKSTEVSIATL